MRTRRRTQQQRKILEQLRQDLLDRRQGRTRPSPFDGPVSDEIAIEIMTAILG